MTIIVGISGRCGSGKTTSSNFILGHSLVSLGIVRGIFNIQEDGKLLISDLYGDPAHEGIFDIKRRSPAFVKFRQERIDPYIKFYSFADPLKEDICVNILGLDRDLVYGSQEDKNKPSGLFWRDMPGICCDFYSIVFSEPKIQDYLEHHEDKEMTVREVLDYVGSKIFRKMNPNCWAEATIRKIANDSPELAIIDDLRFPNEVAIIQANEGVVVRLTRNGEVPTTLTSELALDKDRFDWEGFNVVLDNSKLSIAEQNQAVYDIMASLGLFKEEK